MIFEKLSNRISVAFKGLRSKGKLSEQDIKNAMREIRLALLEADVSLEVVRNFIDSVQELALGQEVLKSLTPGQQVIKIVNEELAKLLGAKNEKIKLASNGPTVIMMCGLQGSGKTTHSAKLAHYFKSRGRRPMLVACDVYRPAAIDQLKLAGQRAKVFVFDQGKKDPVEIATNSVHYAKENGYDIVILDTAGRLHVDEALMEELKRIKKQAQVSETLLVVDSMTGQDAVNVAKKFNELIAINGIVLTKLDSDARGGAALSVVAVTQRPIKFVGLGEKLEDLDEFFPDRMASRILGMGDVMSLIDRVDDFDDKQKEELLDFTKGRFNFNNLVSSMDMMNKFGPVKNVLAMLPGIKGKVTKEQLENGAAELNKVRAIVLSMTPKERKFPQILDASRKKRIAKGCGRKVEDINRIIKLMESADKAMKQIRPPTRKKKARKKRK